MNVRDQELVGVHVLVIGALDMGLMGSFCFAGFDIVGRFPWYFLSGMVDGWWMRKWMEQVKGTVGCKSWHAKVAYFENTVALNLKTRTQNANTK